MSAASEVLDRSTVLEVLEAQFEKYLECGSQESSVDPDVTILDGSELLKSHLNSLDQRFESRTYAMSSVGTRRVNRVFSIDDDDKILFEKFAIPMTSAKLKCLQSGKWLNDEVINMYFLLLRDRDNLRCDVHVGRRRSWVFSTFFIEKLLQASNKTNPGYCYENVMR